MSDLVPGARLRSQVDVTEVVVIRVPSDGLVLKCGGFEMVGPDTQAEPGHAPLAGLDTGNVLGKRYTDEEGRVELLVTKAGSGTLTAGDIVLTIRQPRALPSSD